MGNFKYTLKDTECNYKHFGNCEICGKAPLQVHRLVKQEIKVNDRLKEVSTTYGCWKCLNNLIK
jgi:hypothetical protein